MYKGWSNPIQRVLELRIAVKNLMSREESRVRFTKATNALVGWLPGEFPERLHQRYDNIMKARMAVRKDYPTDTLWHFDRLTVRQRAAIADDIMALYEACLIDIGRTANSGACGEGYVQIVYPDFGEPREPKLMQDRLVPRMVIPRLPKPVEPQLIPDDDP